jgi:hypothetical protein
VEVSLREEGTNLAIQGKSNHQRMPPKPDTGFFSSLPEKAAAENCPATGSTGSSSVRCIKPVKILGRACHHRKISGYALLKAYPFLL